MKTLERNRIDEMVREVESGAYRLALVSGFDPASAERVLLEAFASLAPSFSRLRNTIELWEKLEARIRRAARRRVPVIADAASNPTAVSESLHTRVVDLLEEHQGDEPVGRRRSMLVGLIGVALVGALIAFVKVHADALAAAQPTIIELDPMAAATDVSVSGDVRVKFGRKPEGTPTLHLEPAHGVLESGHWDGMMWVAVYSGLHLSTRYQLVLQADYHSRLKDSGHFERRWTVTTRGYPVVSTQNPKADQQLVPRVGKIVLDFSYQPPAKARLTITPADGVLLPGDWKGTTWSAAYSGLKPLTRYEATLTMDYGAAAAGTQRQWSFSTEPAAPPVGMPVMWYGTTPSWLSSPDPQRLVALDWHGELVGTMYPEPGYIRQVPDGSALATKDGGYLDSNGVRFGPSGSPFIGMVADDSQHVCQLNYGGDGQLWLFTGPLRGPLRRVAPAGATPVQYNLTVIACSVASDRAVLADNGRNGTTVRVVALSSGRVLYQRSSTPFGVGLISSPDGRFLAEETPGANSQDQPTTVIRRTVDGRVVAHLDKQRVLRFSWDGMRVVTLPLFTGHEVTLVDWQTGMVLWRQVGDQPTDSRPVYAFAQPNGPAMAIALGGQPGRGDVDQLWIVAADGQSTQVLSGVFYPAFGVGF